MNMRHLLFVAVLTFLTILAVGQSANTQTGIDQQTTSPPYVAPTDAQKQELERNLKDVHFAFNRADLSAEDRQALEATANWLRANPGVYVTIAGDADERGSIVYNLYLSDQRAKATRDALVSAGVAPERIVFATGWGKLYPTCFQSDESCWSQNRRAHFEPWQAGSVSAASPGAEPASDEKGTLASTIAGE
jgi:outer membrane protein OmpA-like peptidoglycan-associated protein